MSMQKSQGGSRSYIYDFVYQSDNPEVPIISDTLDIDLSST